jgi:hypothetical protein
MGRKRPKGGHSQKGKGKGRGKRKSPAAYIRDRFFSAGGGFFAFESRGMREVKELGLQETFLLMRSMPPAVRIVPGESVGGRRGGLTSAVPSS